MVWVWLIIMILAAAAELFMPVKFITCWFAAGALVSFIFALLKIPVAVQIIVFLVVSVGCLFFLRRPVAEGLQGKVKWPKFGKSSSAPKAEEPAPAARPAARQAEPRQAEPRPAAPRRKPSSPSVGSQFIGKTGFVFDTIYRDGLGQVSIGGVIRTAMSEDGSFIEEGEEIVVVDCQGARLVVRRRWN